MPTLYAISQEIQAILGAADEEMPEDVAARLAEVEMAFELKAESLLKYRQSLLSDVEGIAAEEHRLRERKDSLKIRAEWLRNYLKAEMEKLGLGKVSTATFSATIAKSPPSVVCDEDCEIPKEFQRVKTTVDLDKTAVLNAHKSGKELPPGLHIVQGTNLRIS